MNFYVTGYRKPLSVVPEPPYVLLQTDSWNDYHIETMFNFSLHLSPFASASIHKIKILQLNTDKTVLPTEFSSLTDDYCTLGQSIDFYEELSRLDVSLHQEILSALNDLVFKPEIAQRFVDHKGFKQSLLRASEAEKAYTEGWQYFQRDRIVQSSGSKFVFEYSTTVPGADGPHSVSFDFSDERTGLNRLIAIIGKNGTGKTQYLANLANSLSGKTMDPRKGRFSPSRPLFSKIIAVSYSLFDKFERPSVPSHGRSSYQYCGVLEDDKILDENGLHDNLESAVNEIGRRGRFIQWGEVTRLLNDSTPYVLPPEQVNEVNVRELYSGMSSGQRILFLVISQVVAYIEEESIVLFDEPETHLHPDAIAALTRALSSLLHSFSSYAVIATHSPIVLQEVPTKFVRVFRREGSIPFVTTPGLETFGETLTALTDEVFGIGENRHNYRQHFKRLLREMSVEEIQMAFDGRLSFNAMTYLQSIAFDLDS